MKKFRFPLRTVAMVRNLAELRARENFSKAFQIYSEIDLRLQASRARVAELEEMLRTGRTATFRASDQVTFMSAMRVEAVNATKIEAELKTARKDLETARQAWLETRRDVRVIEKLEDKARLEHRTELEREIQADLDDRTSGMVARELKAAS
jgi:flagellar FliJ protein